MRRRCSANRRVIKNVQGETHDKDAHEHLFGPHGVTSPGGGLGSAEIWPDTALAHRVRSSLTARSLARHELAGAPPLWSGAMAHSLDVPRPRFARRRGRGVALVRGELVKLASLASARRVLAGATLAGIAVSVGLCASHHKGGGSLFDPTVLSLLGLLVAQVMVGAVGVVAFSGDDERGTLALSLAAAGGRRMAVFFAKAAAVAAIAFAVGEVASFASFAIGQGTLAAPLRADIGAPGVLRAVVFGGASVALIALVGLGLASALRHGAAAISSLAALLFVVPALMIALPLSIENALDRLVIANLFAVLVNVGHGRIVSFALSGTGLPRSTLFNAPEALGVLACYAAIALAAGAARFSREGA